MKPVNILNSYGLTNGLANFFQANHSVIIERNPYVSSIIRVTISQTTNTPGIMTPIIDVKPNNRYRLTITGYTTKDTAAFIAIMDDDIHKAVQCPVYLKCENRDVVLEFTTNKTQDSIKIFIVVHEPKLKQKFYISDIVLNDLGEVFIPEPICPVPTEPPKSTVFEPIQECPAPEIIELPEQHNVDKAAVSGDLSNLLTAFHTYNKTNKSLNITDTSITPVVLESHAQELTTTMKDDDCDCDTWIEPVPCIMNVYNQSFSMNCFNQPLPHCGPQVSSAPTKPVQSNIQLENINLGVRVVSKQIKLLKVYLRHIETVTQIITDSYNSLMDKDTTREVDNLKQRLNNIFIEMNFISLATETDVNIFTPHHDPQKMPTLIVDCRGKTINSIEYNVKIERYELGTKINDLDKLGTLLFSENWKIDHDRAYDIVENLRKNINKFHNKAILQCDTLTNRKAVLD
tara:strand:- start:281 stop:1654 length:1374 start_codon:yes stop_codon:yes gene_type:complete